MLPLYWMPWQPANTYSDEKAMARTLDECKAIYDAYQTTNQVLYFCMQRMYDEKYIKGMQMIHSGLIGDVVGMRCHWFRNADWRRPVPSPELEHKINWRLYKESSGGLMTELACHQLEVCNWAAKRMPVSIIGMGDIVYWKDGREVYDSVNVTYRYSDGTKIAYESLISNKFNGMEDQILGTKVLWKCKRISIIWRGPQHRASGNLSDRLRIKYSLLSRQPDPVGDRKQKWNTRHILLLKETLTSTTG